MYVRITFSNGYVGCDETEYLEVENFKDAEVFALDSLDDYAASYEHVATGWDESFDTLEEAEEYYENCSFDITEITEKEYQENSYSQSFFLAP